MKSTIFALSHCHHACYKKEDDSSPTAFLLSIISHHSHPFSVPFPNTYVASPCLHYYTNSKYKNNSMPNMNRCPHPPDQYADRIWAKGLFQFLLLSAYDYRRCPSPPPLRSAARPSTHRALGGPVPLRLDLSPLHLPLWKRSELRGVLLQCEQR